MKCEICHVNEACIELKQITEGSMREAHLCEECAAGKGFKSAAELAGLLIGGGLFPLADGESDTHDLAVDAKTPGCPGCHMRAADFRKTSRLGCGQCYETFSAILEPMIASMQKSDIHRGKHPVREDVRHELNRLRTCLEGAIRKEDYEEAAALRDRIRVLELAGVCMGAPGPVPDDASGRES